MGGTGGSDDDHFLLMMTMVFVGLGGGFKYLLFLPLFGEDSHFD